MRTITLAGVLLVALAFHGAVVSAQAIFVNPGVKLGYTFGDKGGFTVGGEISVTTLPVNASYFLGGLVGLDYCFGAHRTKAHLGLEAGALGVGVDVGPSWVSQVGKSDMGITISPFIGLVLYPYYSTTLMFHGDDIHELGLWGKWPIPVVNNINIFD
ncbi:MAG: hypothetical protein JWQ98_154 [Chlorobi bacterium]|nr:hypothetical protein [Chlorobiota bacterium]